MNRFDKQMALDVVEDALSCLDTPYALGVAAGLCGAFYMCGLLSADEWRDFQDRIPEESWPHQAGRFTRRMQ